MFKLIPPGKRKGNRFYVIRGRIAGKSIEWTTGTVDKSAAESIAAKLIAEFVASPAVPLTTKTFRQAAEAYTAWRKPPWREVQQINRLVAEIGHLPLEAVTSAELHGLANRLCPEHKENSKNRLVVTPCAAIMHYAAESKWCGYTRFKKFKEPQAVTRALDLDDAVKLIAKAEGHLRALLVFLFRHGMRISDAIAIEWERINLQAGTFETRIAKTDRYREKALHPDTVAALAALPAGVGRVGRVFPYANRWAVYRELTPLAVSAGVYFTPHMARHSLGKWLNASGAGQRSIMDALDHTDPKSSMRYQSTDIEVQRLTLAKLPGLAGESVGKRKKA
ncbi:tyrosine-type recombinase/integrase [Dongia sp.]|uniref:tyrosine-type recombinase/integrase n=1 Tax=Dongia sp. TaxID=1977262 RepID=UPI0035B385A4